MRNANVEILPKGEEGRERSVEDREVEHDQVKIAIKKLNLSNNDGGDSEMLKLKRVMNDGCQDKENPK